MEQTKRQLQTRVKEHTSISHPSVINEHLLKNNHNIDWNNIKILDHEPHYFKRSILEMLYIKAQKNGLNLQTDTMLLDNAYSDLLNTINHNFE